MKTEQSQEIIERKQVLFGNQNYEYIKTRDGKERLEKEEIIGNEKIKVILNDESQENSKDIEKHVIDVLSDLYIKRHVKRLI